MPLPRVTIVGNLTRDPEVRFLPAGTAVASLRIGSSDRKKNPDGKWTDGDPCFLDVDVWRDTGEAVANTLTKGAPVVIVGRLRMRTYTKQDGTEVTAYAVEADDIAVPVRGQSGPRQSAPADDPWSSDDIPPF